MLTHIQAPHTDVLKTHETQSISAELLESKGTGSEHLTRVTALKITNNRLPRKVQKELHAFSAKTTIKAKICGNRCICLVIFPDKVEFQGKNASKCNPITQITEKELPSPHKATLLRPNTRTANQSPKQTSLHQSESLPSF